MESVIVSSAQVKDVDSMAIVGYYTQVSTEIAWEENTVSQQLLDDYWNDTTSSMKNGTEGNFSVTHVVLTSLALLLINLSVIVGNILVLLAVYSERSLRTVTNYFIVNLAIADLLLGTLVLPFSSAFEVIHYWPFGEVFCDIWAAVDVLCCTASINSLCCISVDRYIGVTQPLKHRLIMTPRRAITINVFVWLISFGIAVGPLFGWRPVKTSQLECPLSDSVGYVFFSVSGSFYIPSAIIIVLYFRIYRAVSRETKSIQNQTNRRYGEAVNGHAGRVTLRIHVGNNLQALRKRGRRSDDFPSRSSRSRNLSQRTVTFNREKKVAKTLGIVVSVFIICWFPFFFLLPLTSVCNSCKLPQVVFTFFFWLGYCNSCVNPVIYAMSNLTFRRAFRKILTCWYCRDRRPLRRTFGSRRCSNLSRFTSSTAMTSPMPTNLRKRASQDTSTETSLGRSEPRSSRMSSQHHKIIGQNMEHCSGCQVHGGNYSSDGNTKLCDLRLEKNKWGGLSDRLSTIDSESTTENNSVVTDEQAKTVDVQLLNQTSTETENAENNNVTSSNNVIYGFQKPLTKTVSNNFFLSGNLHSKMAAGVQHTSDPLDYYSSIGDTTFGLNPLTNQELSSGIRDSRETPV